MNDFTISYQAQLAPFGDTINLDDLPEVAFELWGHPAVMRVDDRWVTLKVSGLTAPDEAQDWMRRLRSGFAWAMLRHDLPFKPTRELRIVSLPDAWEIRPQTPKRIFGKEFPLGLDALEDRGVALVYPSQAQVARIGMGDVTVSVGRAWKPIAESLNEGSSLSDNMNDERLVTGLDLWASAAYEVSSEARLLTYVMSIESLVVAKPKHARAQTLVDEWTEFLAQASDVEDDPDVRESFDALREELESRRVESVMKAIRRTVRATLEGAGLESEVAQALADIRAVYKARSKLAHEGVLRTPGAENDAKDLSRRVLEAAVRGGLSG